MVRSQVYLPRYTDLRLQRIGKMHLLLDLFLDAFLMNTGPKWLRWTSRLLVAWSVMAFIFWLFI